jgi:hypothetical protein
MVEISGFIHQLYVSEAEKKGNNGKPIFEANCHTNGSNSCQNKNEVSPFPQWLYPTESIVRKEELWLEVQSLNPTIYPKANKAQKHHYTKKHSEKYQWGNIRMLMEIALVQFMNDGDKTIRF